MNDQFWWQNSSGILGIPENYDNFGSSLIAGDFDGDGYDDLTIGVPDEDLSKTNQGAVNVLQGSYAGLTATGDQFWSQDSPGALGVGENYDRFGSSLASGDFDGDGYDDIAIGSPHEDWSGTNEGAVNVLQGSSRGLTATGDQLWGQVSGVRENYDGFGSSLTSGDFDGDGYDDLAIGVPGEDISKTNQGAVNVLQGSYTGLTATSDQFWNQDSFGVLGVGENYDGFGSSLTSGDFDGDGYDDLAIGSPHEDWLGTNEGAVNVLHGSSRGLTATGDQLWHQNSYGVLGAAESSDFFGASLAVGDFDNDGYDDLAIGVPYEDIGLITNAGAVNVLYGSRYGLTATGDQLWHQNSPGVQGVAEAYDSFGSSLTVGDFNKDGYDDLAIGVPGEDTGSIINHGATNILYGSANGLIA